MHGWRPSLSCKLNTLNRSVCTARIFFKLRVSGVVWRAGELTSSRAASKVVWFAFIVMVGRGNETELEPLMSRATRENLTSGILSRPPLAAA